MDTRRRVAATAEAVVATMGGADGASPTRSRTSDALHPRVLPTLEKPSALSVAIGLAQAMCPKENWLSARSIEHRWPMFGPPRLLVADSARSNETASGYA